MGLGAKNEGWTERKRLESGETVMEGRTGLGGREEGELLPKGLEWEESTDPCDSRKRMDPGEVLRLARLSAFDYRMTLLMFIFLNNIYFCSWSKTRKHLLQN